MTTGMHKAPSVARKALTSRDDATPLARYDLSTSEGGRRYIADFFAAELRRHDFAGYINTHLAADFACALAQHLVATGKQQVDAVRALPAEWRARAEELDVGDEIGLTPHLKLKDCADELEAALAARLPATGGYDQSAEDRFEQFVQAEIARSPDALRELGEYLGRVLDEDELPQANSLLLQLATEYAGPPAQGIDLAQLRALAEQWEQLEYPFSYEGQQAQRAADACRADLLALIDQRDAAPGVGNG